MLHLTSFEPHPHPTVVAQEPPDLLLPLPLLPRVEEEVFSDEEDAPTSAMAAIAERRAKEEREKRRRESAAAKAAAEAEAAARRARGEPDPEPEPVSEWCVLGGTSHTLLTHCAAQEPEPEPEPEPTSPPDPPKNPPLFAMLTIDDRRALKCMWVVW